MTTDKCLFHMTISAEEAGLSTIECTREGVRRIVGPDQGRRVVAFRVFLSPCSLLVSYALLMMARTRT